MRLSILTRGAQASIPKIFPEFETVVQRCIDPEGERVYDIEYRVIRKNDGVERWIATRGKTSFKNGKPESFYGVTLDITDRKRFELDLETRSWNEPIGGGQQPPPFSNRTTELAEAELNNCSGSMRLGKSRQASHTTSIIC